MASHEIWSGGELKGPWAALLWRADRFIPMCLSDRSSWSIIPIGLDRTVYLPCPHRPKALLSLLETATRSRQRDGRRRRPHTRSSSSSAPQAYLRAFTAPSPSTRPLRAVRSLASITAVLAARSRRLSAASTPLTTTGLASIRPQRWTPHANPTSHCGSSDIRLRAMQWVSCRTAAAPPRCIRSEAARAGPGGCPRQSAVACGCFGT